MPTRLNTIRSPRPATLAGALVLAVLPAAARAGDFLIQPEPEPAATPALNTAPVTLTLQPETNAQPPLTAEPAAKPAPASPPAPTQLDTAPAAMRFGQTGTHWVALGTGAASNFDNVDYNIFGTYSTFIAENVEFFGELGAWNYSQPGKDATGFNLSMVVRWHWFNNQKWTLFSDVGIGIMASTDPIGRTDVPSAGDGTSFNFTPRLGGGFTRQLTDDGVRLEVGMRWAHVSNARISGNNGNPSRDSVMLYAGLIFPF